METSFCKNHTEKTADYRCTACKNYFCPDCIEKKIYKDFTFTAIICKECGGKCEELKTVVQSAVSFAKKMAPQPVSPAEPVQAREVPTNFWFEVVYNFIYPFKGNGLMVMLAATGFFIIFELASKSIFIIPIAILALYGLAYMKNVIEVSAFSYDSTPPGWPGFHNWLDWFTLAMTLFLAAVICFSPALLYFFKNTNLDFIFYSLLFFGLSMCPMYVLALSLTEQLSSLNPLLVLEAILRTFFPYCVVFILWVFLLSVRDFVQRSPFTHITGLGYFLEWFLFTYMLMVNLRTLGVFFRAYKKHLEWI